MALFNNLLNKALDWGGRQREDKRRRSQSAVHKAKLARQKHRDRLKYNQLQAKSAQQRKAKEAKAKSDLERQYSALQGSQYGGGGGGVKPFVPFNYKGRRFTAGMERAATKKAGKRWSKFYHEKRKDYLADYRRSRGRTTEDHQKLSDNLAANTEEWRQREHWSYGQQEANRERKYGEQGLLGSGVGRAGARQDETRRRFDIGEKGRKVDYQQKGYDTTKQRTFEDLGRAKNRYWRDTKREQATKQHGSVVRAREKFNEQERYRRERAFQDWSTKNRY